MGYRGGPTPRGEQGPSFYYPGSHDGSQPWPNLIFSRTSGSLARSRSRVSFSVNIRVRPICTYPRPRSASRRVRTLRVYFQRQCACGHAAAPRRAAPPEEQPRRYFYPTRVSTSVARASERASERRDGCTRWKM